jgi:protein arginine kinase activator
MLCDICGKNQATVHLTEIVDGQMAELHLCEDCAKEKSLQMEQQFGLADLLAGLADFGKTVDSSEKIKLTCSTCGLGYDNFRKLGRLGCAGCYVSFRKYLVSLLKNIHGSSQHIGKTPVKAGKIVKEKSQLQELKNKLQRAIQLEEFEEAASLRDRIRELEQKEKNAA